MHTSHTYQDPSQLSLFECFSELISDEELANMASFDEGDKPGTSSSHSSSSEDHKKDFGNFNVKSQQTHATMSLASELTMDDDPDFRVAHQASRPVHSGTNNMKSIQHTKETSQISGKVVSTKSGRGNRDKTSSQKQHVKHKTSTNASRLANYLLQHVDGTPMESDHHKHQVSQATCIDRDACEENTEGECKPGDGADSLEWFGFDSEEDLDNFEHFDDEADFPT